jgi:fructose-specific phosphotransferase system IIA component
MKIASVLEENHVFVQMDGKTKEDAIKFLVESIADSGIFEKSDDIFHAVLDRERIMTTGVGNGVAIPHCKHASCNDFKLAIGISKNLLDFNSIDKKPVSIVFLLVGPNTVAGNHIKLLSKISKLISREEIREKILEFSSEKEVYDFIIEQEKSFI